MVSNSYNINGQSFTLAYDAENRLVSVTGAATASFVYDADGKQVKTVVNGVTTYYVGNHYEVKNSVVTKYYFAGATRLAVRTGGTLSYLLGDHIGSSSVTTDANGAKTASALYKAFGETRYTLGNLGTDYKFTGQREEASLGIYFFQSRWFDPSLGRFTQPDTIVPTGSQGTQAWDRYAFVNNNPVRYNDPTGHWATGDEPTHYDFSVGTNVCMDPKATNYRAEGSCVYPSVRAGTSSSPSANGFPYFNAMFKFPRVSSNPLLFYVTPIAFNMSYQPSITVSNGSPLTLASDGEIIYNSTGNPSLQCTFNGTNHSVGFGSSTANQLNDQLANITGGRIDVAPNQLDFNFTGSSVTNIPGTELSIGVNTKFTYSVRYNPLTLGVAAVASGLGALYFGGAAIAPFFNPVPVGVSVGL